MQNQYHIIGILLNDRGYIGLDLSDPASGNPGVGGTQYMFLCLAYYLKKNFNDIEIVVFHFENTNKILENVENVLIENEHDALEVAKNRKLSALIQESNKNSEWYRLANEYRIPIIVWAHCYIDYPEISFIKKYDNVKKVVFVGKQEYDHYIDDAVINKCTYIFNMYVYKECERKLNFDKKNIVVYMGSLSKEKGFHVLARNWHKVLKHVPDAELWVLGSGNLYSRTSRLGKYGIADSNYEKMFMPYITEGDRIINSVKFLGIVGANKEDLFKQCKVGVVNPTAISETFCLSAVEMEGSGVPVVSKKKYGLCDTIIDNQTGKLFSCEGELSKFIIELLNNEPENKKYSKNAIEFVRTSFDPNEISKQWHDVFGRLDKQEQYIPPCNHYCNDAKIIRLINRNLNKLVNGNSIVYYKYLTKKMLHILFDQSQSSR